MTKTSSFLQELEACHSLIDSLKTWDHHSIFSQPVDIVALEIPDYPSIVKNPMDLGTVESRLKKNDYAHAYEFWADLQLIWKNALIYNTEGQIRDWAMQLRELCSEKFRAIQKASDENDKPKCSTETRHRLMSTLRGLKKSRFKECFQLVSTKCSTALKAQKDNTITLFVHRITETTAKDLIQTFANDDHGLKNVAKKSS